MHIVDHDLSIIMAKPLSKQSCFSKGQNKYLHNIFSKLFSIKMINQKYICCLHEQFGPFTYEQNLIMEDKALSIMYVKTSTYVYLYFS